MCGAFGITALSLIVRNSDASSDAAGGMMKEASSYYRMTMREGCLEGMCERGCDHTIDH